MEKQRKYEELLGFIRGLIQCGTLEPGEKIYSEKELARMFDVSRQTVRRAVGILEEEGLVRRSRGSGTYVMDERQENISRKSQIAVVTTYVESYIFPRMIQGIEETLFEHGCSVQIAFTNNATDREKNVLENILKRDDVAGLIVEGTRSGLPNPNIPLYRQFRERGIPVVFINTYYPEVNAPHISLNDVEAAYQAVKFLIGKGHRRIGGIFKLDDGQGRLRYLGYLRAMEEAGLPVTDSWIVWIDTDEVRQLSTCIHKICSRMEPCSALLCYNDQVAFQLIRLLRERGIQVPQQLSVISIDDSDLADLCEVPITSLPHPKEKLGKKAAEAMLKLMGGARDSVTYEFDTCVVERASVMAYEKGPEIKIPESRSINKTAAAAAEAGGNV